MFQSSIRPRVDSAHRRSLSDHHCVQEDSITSFKAAAQLTSSKSSAQMDSQHQDSALTDVLQNQEVLEDAHTNGSSTPNIGPPTPPTPGRLSRNNSFSNASSIGYDDDSTFPPLERLTILDMLENLALPQRLEQLHSNVTESVRRQQQRLRSGGRNARDKVVEEWRRRVPTPDEQLDKYRRRMRESVDRIGKQWNDHKTVTVREKAAFIASVFNIFFSGYLIGSHPEKFHLWYAAQLAYFMPIRWYTYHQKGYHYFLADLCYFVNLLLVLSIWVFPQSKRLLISTFCLAFGNNAVAIVMWRNMLVFHSLDKVTSLFIHIMPCMTLHCLVHLIPAELQKTRFPAIYNIKTAPRGAPYHYSPLDMLLWCSFPYFLWQASYYLFITVRRADKVAAGRPTSFVWLKRSYRQTWIGKLVAGLPESLQEFAFMGIQYCYAMTTTLPCALWFWYRPLSAAFLLTVFAWSVYKGATYYIDFFGRRFEKELEQLKKDVARLQATSDGLKTPILSPEGEPGGFNMNESANTGAGADTASSRSGHRRARSDGSSEDARHPHREENIYKIPSLNDNEKVNFKNPADKKNA